MEFPSCVSVGATQEGIAADRVLPFWRELGHAPCHGRGGRQGFVWCALCGWQMGGREGQGFVGSGLRYVGVSG